MSAASWSGGFPPKVIEEPLFPASEAVQERMSRKRARAEALNEFERAEVRYYDSYAKLERARDELARIIQDVENHKQSMQQNFDALRRIAAEEGIDVHQAVAKVET